MMQDALEREPRPSTNPADRPRRQTEANAHGAGVIRFPRAHIPAAASEGQPRRSQNAKGPTARILKPAPSPVQSGRANARRWVLEFEPQSPLFIEPLMGWTGSTDPMRQVRLTFPDRESAVRFAERQGYAYTVSEPHERRIRPKRYADKFRSRPRGSAADRG